MQEKTNDSYLIWPVQNVIVLKVNIEDIEVLLLFDKKLVGMNYNDKGPTSTWRVEKLGY